MHLKNIINTLKTLLTVKEIFNFSKQKVDCWKWNRRWNLHWLEKRWQRALVWLRQHSKLCRSDNYLYRCQYQQHFTNSFYTLRSQKCKKKHWRLECLFVLSESLCVKAVHKHVGKIEPRFWFKISLKILSLF